MIIHNTPWRFPALLVPDEPPAVRRGSQQDIRQQLEELMRGVTPAGNHRPLGWWAWLRAWRER